MQCNKGVFSLNAAKNVRRAFFVASLMRVCEFVCDTAQTVRVRRGLCVVVARKQMPCGYIISYQSKAVLQCKKNSQERSEEGEVVVDFWQKF